MQALQRGLDWLGAKLDDWFRDNDKAKDAEKTSSQRRSLELLIVISCVRRLESSSPCCSVGVERSGHRRSRRQWS